MKKNRIITVFIFFLITVMGCQKEDYTLPTAFRLNMSISKKPALGGSLVIDEIKIRLKSIEIQGYRETGGDVFMSRPYQKGKIFTIKASRDNESVNFDIPQGVYNQLSFSLVFKHDEDEDELIEDIEEWYEDINEGDDDLEEFEEELGSIIDDYIEDIEPSILVSGRFNSNKVNARVILLVNDPMTFRIIAKNADELPEVVLRREKENAGILLFDPSYWFSVITPDLLNNAFVGRDDGVIYIFLSKYVNSQIYQAVFNRMEESTSITINK